MQDSLVIGELKCPLLCFIGLLIFTEVSEISVELVGSGSMEVGSVYTLTCTVALSHRASDSSVSILWEGPSTHEQTVDTTDSRLVTRQLSLDPLSLADGGDYTCTASYTTDGGTTVTRSDTEIVTPISKSSPVLTSLYSYPYIQLYLHLWCSE